MVSYLHSAGLTLVSFAVLISVIVFFHELGHLLVGKWLGVKALRFSIGFGPRLFGVQWGETEYRVSLLPLGGYVKFAGDNPLEELPPEDRGRGFLEQPPRKKAAIAFAGPAANFLLALILYFAVNAAPHRDIASAVGYVKPGSPAAQAGIPRAAYDEDVARIRRLVPGPLRRTARRIPDGIQTVADAIARSGIQPRVRGWIARGSIADLG